MKHGFVGLGNMGLAIIKGMIDSRNYPPGDILAYDPYSAAGRAAVAAMGVEVCPSLAAVAAADILLLAVKPQVMPSVLKDLRASDLSKKLIISIAAGRSLTFLQEGLGHGAAIIRVMPNINAKVGAAISAFAATSHCGEAHKDAVRALFATVGTIVELAEEHFSIFTAVAGSSPAFSYMYIDALARAAVRGGIPKAKALEIAASAVYGSAKMILEGNEHPFALVDQVCSPGGTTIEGVCRLQECGFESAVHKAVAAVALKDAQLA
ncbi:MAG: pyrroline-5-carboxylate reductase [Desulfovibrio sp.]|nr:pyrroline-5-carboxylate reductase [Desulfovibrio sp.]